MRWLLLVSLIAGCGPANSSDAGTAPTDAPIGDASAPDAGPLETATLEFGPDPLPVGEERTVCVVLDAGNDVARQVRGLRTHLPAGSHHMILYRTNDPLNAAPAPCFPFADGGSAFFIAETVEATLRYPADAALTFRPHQHVRIEIHEVNYQDVPLDVRASVSFDYDPLGAPLATPVQFLFTGDMTLSLPARSASTATSFHIVPEGARIFGLTSHTHSLGVYASIHRASSPREFTELLHESSDWANPRLDLFEPPLVLTPSEGLRLSCEYENTTDRDVSFGLDFADEMCFLWAYYY